MAGERVDLGALVGHVTQLATDHADLVVLVQRLLESPIPCNDLFGSVDLHVGADDLTTLRRLTGSP